MTKSNPTLFCQYIKWVMENSMKFNKNNNNADMSNGH